MAATSSSRSVGVLPGSSALSSDHPVFDFELPDPSGFDLSFLDTMRLLRRVHFDKDIVSIFSISERKLKTQLARQCSKERINIQQAIGKIALRAFCSKRRSEKIVRIKLKKLNKQIEKAFDDLLSSANTKVQKTFQELYDRFDFSLKYYSDVIKQQFDEIRSIREENEQLHALQKENLILRSENEMLQEDLRQNRITIQSLLQEVKDITSSTVILTTQDVPSVLVEFKQQQLHQKSKLDQYRNDIQNVLQTVEKQQEDVLASYDRVHKLYTELSSKEISQSVTNCLNCEAGIQQLKEANIKLEEYESLFTKGFFTSDWLNDTPSRQPGFYNPDNQKKQTKQNDTKVKNRVQQSKYHVPSQEEQIRQAYDNLALMNKTWSEEDDNTASWLLDLILDKCGTKGYEHYHREVGRLIHDEWEYYQEFITEYPYNIQLKKLRKSEIRGYLIQDGRVNISITSGYQQYIKEKDSKVKLDRKVIFSS